ncbi:MAG: CHAT domain-containing protein [Deltaproteobacteria bacterium]|nr:CHAT domain-containing protein [Deltaproteobacteria bacterium]
MANVSSFPQEATLELELARSGGRLTAAVSTRTTGGSATARHYEDVVFQAAFVEEQCAAVVRLLNNANYRCSLAEEGLAQLKKVCFVLFETLLPHAIQQELAVAECRNLVITLDDGLVHVPWELLYDGTGFLCRRFNTGRVVRTRGRVAKHRPRNCTAPVKALVVCDPRGDLDGAYREGDRIRTAFDSSRELIHADLLNRRIESKLLKQSIRDYDIVHYAGHADYAADNPAHSGWLLAQGTFSAEDIHRMSRNVPMPLLVFANACQSGQTGEWLVDEQYGDRVYGLAHAFLMAGVRHYLGTFWEVLDEAGCEFAAAFYQGLLQGACIGHAVRQARETVVERYGEGNLVWAAYVLYGEPGFNYFGTDTRDGALAANAPQQRSGAYLRPAGAVRSLPPDRKTFNVVLLALTVALISVSSAGYYVYDRSRSDCVVARGPQQAGAVQSAAAADERINDILAGLSLKYEEQKLQGLIPERKPAQGAAPPSLSILGFSCIGGFSDRRALERFFAGSLSRALHASGSVRLVERKRIRAVLDELRIGTAEIADHDAALVLLGRLVGARLICVGEVIRVEPETVVNLRVFETETSRIVITLQEVLEDGNRLALISKMGQKLQQEITQLYPTQKDKPKSVAVRKKK